MAQFKKQILIDNNNATVKTIQLMYICTGQTQQEV